MQSKRISDIIRRLAQRLQEEEHEYPNLLISPSQGIDDGGGYGDPHKDSTPDWIKADEAGWIKLGKLGDN